ncbi:MAG: haloacid dehalogenase-like hydrolase [Gemmatimonadota bacterium]|nr:MAG: haloacid dehalogenase-like hydrolase [Gemmatimonadota bacterium]
MQQAATPIRVRVFFDIDGTLLYTDGAGRVAVQAALEAVYGTSGPIDGYIFHGKTDPRIVVELMVAAGFDEAEVRRRMPRVWPIYLRALERELEVRRREGRVTLLPGVVELLAALDSRGDVTVGLLTGNIEEGARLKLAAAGLGSTFELGGFGSDSEDRAEVARVALERSRPPVGDAEPVTVVVGDTPEDVACARAVEAYAVAVATGRHSVEQLEETGADAVFEDFSDTGAVLSCVLKLAGTEDAAAGAAGHGGDR